MCFCNHRYKYHDFDSVKDKKVKCKKCACKSFEHVPCYGANDVKCLYISCIYSKNSSKSLFKSNGFICIFRNSNSNQK